MGLLDGLTAALFGDAGFRDTRIDLFDSAALSDLLPYRIYDQGQRVYFNEKTIAFMFEIFAHVDRGVAENFHAALTTSLPGNGGVQIVSWSSPDIDQDLAAWAAARTEGDELGEEMVASRMRLFQSMRYGVDAPIRAIPTRRRRFVIGWIEGETSLTALAALEEYRRSVLGAFGLKRETSFPPEALIGLLQEMLHAERWGSEKLDAVYADDVPINAQIPGAALDVAPNEITLAGEPKMTLRAGSVARFPKEWMPEMTAAFFGNPDVISDRPHGPLLVSLTAHGVSGQKATGDILKRRTTLEHSKKTGFAKFMPDRQGKEDELSRLADQLESGERLFEAVMTVVSFAKGGRDEARLAQAEMAKIFRRAGFGLRQERYLQLPLLLSALPMGSSQGAMTAYKRLQRMRILKGASVAALAPLHAEWPGNSFGKGMLLMGRQGQIFTWSNFVSTGNYNVAVVGKSGSGKSVFMQELITSIHAMGGRALVIDDGYSFKTTCDILGGRHVAMDGSQVIRLNPFSMLQADKMGQEEYAAEAIELVTRVISTMASLGEQREGRVAGIEEEAISRAVTSVWQDKGQDGEISDVLDLLRAWTSQDARLADVCAKLQNYARDGIYGSYFVGKATVNVDTALTVVELSDVKSQPGLEQVILQIIMFLGTELMYKTDRSVPVAILIDEAWDLLKGGNTAKFIEGVVRRARKYTGALITGTQSIDDYYQNPAAEVCLQNSDWTVFLAQKPETIDRLVKDKKLSVPDGMAERLKTVTSVPGQFSEMAIKGPGGWALGRLALDPFSLAVFSSKGATVEQLRRLKASGMSTVAALRQMVEKGQVE